jgi:hypothetical protein
MTVERDDIEAHVYAEGLEVAANGYVSDMTGCRLLVAPIPVTRWREAARKGKQEGRRVQNKQLQYSQVRKLKTVRSTKAKRLDAMAGERRLKAAL